MEQWSHRAAFKEAVKAYRLRADLRLADVAEKIGLREQTLKDYLYRKDVKPSLEVLQKAASIFGCSVMEFIDDPGNAPPGIDPAIWAGISNRQRVLAGAMMADLLSLPEDQMEAYYSLYTQGIFKGLAKIRAEESANK